VQVERLDSRVVFWHKHSLNKGKSLREQLAAWRFTVTQDCCKCRVTKLQIEDVGHDLTEQGDVSTYST
jgi:hypothetical protein